MTQGSSRTKTKRSLITLLILVLVFAIPMGIAWYVSHNKSLKKQNTTNRGQLIIPPFPVSALKLINNHKQRITPIKNKRGQWMLVLLYPNPCDKQCQQRLVDLRQIQKATGKNIKRITRALLMYGAPRKHAYAGARLLGANQQQFTATIKRYVKAPYALQKGTIYVVDPLGNVMMTYQPNANRRAIFKDLQRLLKVSQIG